MQSCSHQPRLSQNSSTLQQNVNPSAASTIAEQNDDSDESLSFLGNSSAVGFMNEVYDSLTNPTPQSHQRDTGHAALNRPLPAMSSWFVDPDRRADPNMPTDDIWLPPRRTADELLETYFECAHAEFPIFFKPAFLDKYERLWLPVNKDTVRSGASDSTTKTSDSVHSHQIFQLMLYLVFALAQELTKKANGQRQAFAATQQDLTQSAVRLISFETMMMPSLRRLQALLLLARIYQFQGLSNRCWAVTGLAIRMAQSMGLNREIQSGSQAQKEEKRRVWCCCILLDRTQSMTFGRPLMLSDETGVLPQPIDDEFLNTTAGGADGRQPPHERPRTAFFVWAIKSMELYVGILKTFFHPSNELEAGKTCLRYESIYQFDAAIQQFCDSLPVHLRYNETSQPLENPYFVRQAILLHYRVLNLRLMLFRKPLVHFVKGENSSPTILQTQFLQACVDSCVASAGAMVSLVAENIHTDSVPPVWFTTFLTYNAGIVLVIVLRLPELNKHMTDDQRASVEALKIKCMSILQEYHQAGVSIAKRCVETLQQAQDNGARSDDPGQGDVRQEGSFAGGPTLRRPPRAQSGSRAHQESDWIAGERPAQLHNAFTSTSVDSAWIDQSLDWLNGLADFDNFASGGGINDSAIFFDT